MSDHRALSETSPRGMLRDERLVSAESSAAGWRRIPVWAGAVVAAVGLLAFAGWALDVGTLKRILPAFPTMKANTALCFFFSGLALALHTRRALRFVFAGIVFAVAGLTFVQYLAGADFGLDQLLFRDQTDTHTVFPGRMAEATALGFLLSSVSLLLLGAQARAGRRAQQTLAVCAGVIGVVALLGYAYNAQQLYRFVGYSSMALHTAASFVVLAIGLIFARPDGLARVLIAQGPAAALARSMLPAALLLPAALGWLVWWGLYQGYYGLGMDLALLVLALMLSFAALVLGTAHVLEHSDAKRREAEAAQRASEERLRFSLESCQIGAWDIDLVNHTAYRSLEHDRIFGYQELLPSWTLDDFLGHAMPEYRAEVEAMVRAATARKTGWTYECQIRRVDGEVRWIWFSGQHRTDSSGRSRVAGVIQDITERKHAEAALRQSEKRFRVAQEHSPDGFTILRPERDAVGRVVDFTFVYANAATERTVDMKLAALAGRSLLELFPGHVGSPFLGAYQQVAETGQMRVLESPYHGHGVLAQRWFRNVVVSMGQDIAVLSQDTTERKRAEQALHQSNQEMEEFNQAMVGRELRMIELKQEINALCAQLGQPPRYELDTAEIGEEQA